MEQKLTHPKYIYADILIGLAQADGHVDARERELLDGIFTRMQLDPEAIQEMWLTPRTLDIIEAMLRDIPDRQFMHCLLKDCFLLAYADRTVDAGEHRFIKRITDVMDLSPETIGAIHDWVRVAVDQKRKAEELFGADAACLNG